MRLSTFIARIGTNMQFVAFNAHWGVTAFVVLVASRCVPFVWVSAAVLIAAAIKEFWFDATYEVPEQSFLDNLEDWLGYAVGVAAAFVFLKGFAC